MAGLLLRGWRIAEGFWLPLFFLMDALKLWLDHGLIILFCSCCGLHLLRLCDSLCSWKRSGVFTVSCESVFPQGD